jgi:hypothetical protein
MNEIPKKTLILEAADGEVGLSVLSPYAFCLEAQNGDVTFTTLNENTDSVADTAAQAETKTLRQDKRLYGRYVRIEVATGELLVYVKDKEQQ